MKHFNKKIKIALIASFVILFTFVALSKAGVLFSMSDDDIIVVSTTNKSFDPNNYVASVAAVSSGVPTTTKMETTTTTETTTKSTTVATTTTTKSLMIEAPEINWDGAVLSKSKGVVIGPSGKETYYNLSMTSIINSMRRRGFSEEEYPYWVRSDGVKMLGGYVMVAANYNIRPLGTKLETSLGYGIVCDTGGFVKNNPTQIDIAVTW